MTNQEIAQALLEFYGDDESRWTQGAYARDKHKQLVDVRKAVCWCLFGALKYRHLQTAAEDSGWWNLFNGSVVDWNDAEGRTFEQVKQKLQEIANG